MVYKFNSFMELTKTYNKPIGNKKNILEEIETLILFKQYFQNQKFMNLIISDNLKEKTLEHILILKNNLDYKLDLVTELYPLKKDFEEIMEKYKKLDKKGYEYYVKIYNEK